MDASGLLDVRPLPPKGRGEVSYENWPESHISKKELTKPASGFTLLFVHWFLSEDPAVRKGGRAVKSEDVFMDGGRVSGRLGQADTSPDESVDSSALDGFHWESVDQYTDRLVKDADSRIIEVVVQGSGGNPSFGLSRHGSSYTTKPAAIAAAERNLEIFK